MQKKTIAHQKLTLRIVGNANGLAVQEIIQAAQLSKNIIKNVLNDLKQADKIYESGGYYYATASRLQPYVTRRAWNSDLFAGVVI
jgi:hypothetical protein